MKHIDYNHIISIENLLCAWQEFQKGKRYKKDVATFSLDLMKNILEIHQELKNKTYQHGQYQHFKINDPKPRDIHKALVRDRLIHHAIYRVLYPYFDRKFIYDSYSCRRNKGTHRALDRFRTFSRIVSKNYTRQCFILKCDIKKFFASIDHDVLKNILAKHISDTDILWLLGQVICSFDKGLPLGNLTSQLLVNIYMNEFDHFVKRDLKVKYYIRYADDFVILSADKFYLAKLIPKIDNFLKEKLKLNLHPNKVFIKTFSSGVDFLGFVHFAHHRVLRTTTKRRIFKKLQKLKPGDFLYKEKMASYLGLLKWGNCYKIFMKLRIDSF